MFVLSFQVQVGNFRHTIAKVQLGGSELAIVVSIVVCCVLLLLCTVGKSCPGWWMCICCGNGCSRCEGDKCNSGVAASPHLLHLSWKHKDTTVPLDSDSIWVPSLLHTWCNYVCSTRVGWAGRGLHFLCAFLHTPLIESALRWSEKAFSLLVSYLFSPKF